MNSLKTNCGGKYHLAGSEFKIWPKLWSGCGSFGEAKPSSIFYFFSPNLAPDHNLRAKFLIPIPPDHTFRLIPRHVIVKLNLQLPLADLLYLQCSFVRPSSVTPPLISTKWCFRPYKPYIFCEDMILATCQCHILSYIPSIWVSHSCTKSSLQYASNCL